MSDSVTSSAAATGDLDSLSAAESKCQALFGPDRMNVARSSAVDRALEDVVDSPAIGAIAASEMARTKAGWTASLGAKNGLARYKAFNMALVDGGWFKPARRAMSPDLPAFLPGNPVGSIKDIVSIAHGDLAAADQQSIARALIRSLSHSLGPDGVPAERIDVPAGLLGKPEVLERRTTTVASNVLKASDAPKLELNWRTEVFTRTKDGKDDPKEHNKESNDAGHYAFDLERWQSGDRSALLDYYRYTEDWLAEFNTSGGRTRALHCFDTLMAG